MIQADFILVANREDINSSNWNVALLNAAADAYPRAIEDLVKTTPSMRYSWIRYLPIGRFEQNALRDFKTSLLTRLKSSPVLETHHGKLKAPSSLIYVPKQYRDREGVPITLTRELGDKYLSQHYDAGDWKYLEALGVREFSKDQFLVDLRACLKERKG